MSDITEQAQESAQAHGQDMAESAKQSGGTIHSTAKIQARL